VPAGQKLKSLRNRHNITVREVEQASHRIAEVKGDNRFSISNGWLAQLENGGSEPSIWKLFSLSVIYHVNLLDLLLLYDIDVNQISRNGNGDSSAEISAFADGSSNGLNVSQTANGEDCPNHIIYVHLGIAEFTMYPMIRPGALLMIDTSQNKIVPNGWRNEYERPIYFIELRGGYACGWCELQGNQLLIIPHHSSPATVRRFTYPREAEIVGRVVSYSTNCIDLAQGATTL
jgi:transcriptional regulator with XRE-family HTH domain